MINPFNEKIENTLKDLAINKGTINIDNFIKKTFNFDKLLPIDTSPINTKSDFRKFIKSL
jgi:hypothetical protein